MTILVETQVSSEQAPGRGSQRDSIGPAVWEPSITATKTKRVCGLGSLRAGWAGWAGWAWLG